MTKLLLLFSILCFAAMNTTAQLAPNFYNTSCPSLETVVSRAVDDVIAQEGRMGASLLRLHFHDCFVQGCDASVLLDESVPGSERRAFANSGSIRGFEVVDAIKAKVEAACPGIVSCADLLAIIARDTVVKAGGPTWTVLMGRRDSTGASIDMANRNLPPFFLKENELEQNFAKQGLSVKDMVALSGAHTVGMAQCRTFKDRIYKSIDNCDPNFAQSLMKDCTLFGQDDHLAPMDLETPNIFDNKYYVNLLAKKGLIMTDQVLFSNSTSDALVRTYASNQQAFFDDFAASMVKMGNIGVLTGSAGTIRRTCTKLN